MRAFIAASAAMIVVAIVAFFVLQQVQKPVAVAFATSGARVSTFD
jgi:hypothetical protein